MGHVDSEDTAIAFADVVAALQTLGGAAHSDIISRQILQAKRLASSARSLTQARVRRLLAEQERAAAATVRRVFGEDSNRWRLN